MGGNGSARPRLADLLVEDLDFQAAIDIVARVVAYSKEHSKRERVGRMVDLIGLSTIKMALVN